MFLISGAKNLPKCIVTLVTWHLKVYSIWIWGIQLDICCKITGWLVTNKPDGIVAVNKAWHALKDTKHTWVRLTDNHTYHSRRDFGMIRRFRSNPPKNKKMQIWIWDLFHFASSFHAVLGFLGDSSMATKRFWTQERETNWRNASSLGYPATPAGLWIWWLATIIRVT